MKKDTISRHLKFLTLKLTNRCNMNCLMCGQANTEFDDIKQDLDIEIIKHTLLKTKEIERVYLFGGEPLIYNNIKQLLNFLYEIKMPTLITTNGKLLNEYAEIIVENQVGDIEISIDSSDKFTYEEIRGAGSYEQIFEGLNKLIALKNQKKSVYPHIKINSVLLPQNYNQINLIYNYFIKNYPEIELINIEFPMKMTQKIGKDTNLIFEKIFGCISKKWDGFCNEKIMFSDKEALIIENQITTLNDKEKFHFKGPTNHKSILHEVSENYIIPKNICEYPFLSASILHNGDVTFCVDFPDYIIGNIYKESLLDIWKGERAEVFRNYFEKEGNLPLCSRCTHRFEHLHKEIIE